MNRRLLQSLSREHVGSFAWRRPAAKGAEEGEHIVHKYRQNGSEIDEFPSAVINNSFVRPSFDYFRYFVYSKKERKKTGKVNQTCENANSTYSPRSQFFRRVFIPESSNGAVARAAPSPHSKHAYQQYLPYVSGRLTAIRKNRGLKRGTARNTIPSRAIPPLRNPRLARPPSLPLLLPRPTIRHNQLRFYFHPANRAKKKRKNPKDSFRSLQARKLAQRDHRSLLSSPSCQPFSPPPPSLTIPD